SLAGMEIPLKGILNGIGVAVHLGGNVPANALPLAATDTPSLGTALGVFKAAQLASSRTFANAFRDFTAVDIETTGKDVRGAEVVELAAARVRDGQAVEEFHSYVKPRVAIEAGARRTHGIGKAEVADAPFFEDVWPRFRE